MYNDMITNELQMFNLVPLKGVVGREGSGAFIFKLHYLRYF